MENYIINLDTLVVLPHANGSKIIEKYKEVYINKSPTQIINDSCKYYGSSLKGRCESTYYLIGIKYKCPIIISEVQKIILFPTASYNNKECIWFNYNSILNYYSEYKKNKLIIHLINNKNITINISKNVISNQIFKSARLESIIKSKNR